MNTDFTVSDVKKRRSTVQKQVILDTLIRLGNHVSASAVYQELQNTHPHIGRATVFRVLSDMASDGRLLRVTVAGSDDRYDITVAPHCHIHCRSCGKVDDIFLDCEPSLRQHIQNASGFRVDGEHIEFNGLCRECQKSLPASENDAAQI